MDRDRLLSIMSVLSAADEDDGKLLRSFQAIGLSKDDAIRAMHLVPVGLARPLLERLGVTTFSDKALVIMQNAYTVEFSLSKQPEYAAALLAGRDHFDNGTLPRNQYESIVFSSSEVGVINNAMNRGKDVRGAAVATVFHDVRLSHLVRL